MWKINLVFIVVIALNLIFVCWIHQMEKMPAYQEILVSLPIAIINGVTIWWLWNGGKWRR